MKSVVALAVLIMCIYFFTNGTAPFFGNKYWILLGQTKPGKHHPGITIKEETNVTISDARKADDGCLNSWIFTRGYMYLAQDGSLDFTGKSFTVGGYYYYTGAGRGTDIMILWQSSDVYLATFGANPNGNSYHNFNLNFGLSNVNIWLFVGFSLDSSKNKLMGWVDDVVTRVNISSSSPTDLMKGDIIIGKYGKNHSAPQRVELAGLTVMAGAIEETQIETFKADIRSTLAPTCTDSGTNRSSGFPLATMMLLALIVDVLPRL